MDMKIMVEQRQIRGYSILAKGVEPKPIDEETYVIPSQNGNGKYKVYYKDSEWFCECPDNTYRGLECKHIHALKFWLTLKEKINSEDTFEIVRELDDNVICPYCSSLSIVKNGSRKCKNGNKQRYRCKDCNKTFIPDKEFDKIRGDPKIITLILDLYFKGLSLRKIKDHLKQFYGMEIHHETIRRWILRFTKIMNEYVKMFKPKVSGVWQADEQMIKTKGKWLWSWNILDEETRFLIANSITENREINDARKVFRKAKNLVKENPDVVITDGLWSYEKAVRKELQVWKGRSDRTQHIRLRTIRDKVQNNKVERYHGTWRERDKVMRGFKGKEKELMNAFRMYYNFIRKHQALNGKTPSEVAEIDLNLDNNRWLSLLRKGLDYNTTGSNNKTSSVNLK